MDFVSSAANLKNLVFGGGFEFHFSSNINFGSTRAYSSAFRSAPSRSLLGGDGTARAPRASLPASPRTP